jgi:DNA-binding XRE family transcriptional regulator
MTLDDIALIPEIIKQNAELIEQNKEMLERLNKFAPPLTTKKEVAKFLNVTTRTINNYISQGYLIEGYHFKRKNAKVIEFIEDAIFSFRDEMSKGTAHEKVAI